MSDYTKSTNFATKDNLTPGDPLKIVRGTEIDTEFNNIATAIATKTDNASAAITGGSITGITDLAIADGGTGASTANAALNNLLPSQTSASGKYLKSNGTDSSWDALDISTADITGTLPVANGGTGVTSSTGTGSVVLSNSPTLVTPALGTPASGVATNITGLPISTGVSGLGTGVATALAVNVGSAGAPLVNGGVLGTPSSGTATNLTGLPLTTGVTGTLPIANGGTGQTTANAAFNALAPSQATASGKYLKSDGTNTSWDALDISTADITGTLPVANGGTGVTTSTGTGSVVLSNSPTLVTPALGTPSSATLTNATGLPISTGVSGLGTGVATALAVNVGSAGAPVVNGGALGTPSSGTVTNLTGTASININGTVGATTPTTGAFTTVSASSSVTLSGGTANGVTYLNGSKVLTSGSALVFDGTKLGVGTSTPQHLLDVSASTSGGKGGEITISNSAARAASNYSRLSFAPNSDFTSGGVIGAYIDGIAPSSSTTNAVDFIFGTGTGGAPTEKMRLDSLGNLGIGTSSPAAKLDVANGNVRITQGASVGATLSIAGNGNTVGTTSLDFIQAADSAAYIVQRANSFLSLYTNSTEAIRITAAGSVGIGTNSPAAKLEISATTEQLRLTNSSNRVRFTTESDGTLTIGNTSFSLITLKQNIGGAVVYGGFQYVDTNRDFALGAASGKGVAILVNGASTASAYVDSSGNLGVGTTSPSTFGTFAVKTSLGSISIASGGSVGARLKFYDSSNTQTAEIINNGGSNELLQISATAATGSILFNTNSSERARIDSSGNLLVGTTSGGSRKLEVVTSGTNHAISGLSDTAGYATFECINSAASGTRNFIGFRSSRGGADVGSITYNGTLTAYNATSDYRLKTVHGAVTGHGERIDALEPVEYTWNSNGSRTRGFLAHKFQEVYADSVTGEKDAVDADGNPVYQAMQASTPEVIADLVAEIQSLRQRVAQLETN